MPVGKLSADFVSITVKVCGFWRRYITKRKPSWRRSTNIINLSELRTWVCDSCVQNIERFYTFRDMLQRNVTDFNERFLKEQKETQNQMTEHDNHLIEMRFDDFSDNEDCYELACPDIENNSVSSGTSYENEWNNNKWLIERNIQANEISEELETKIEVADTVIQENIERLLKFENEVMFIKCEDCHHKFPPNAKSSNEETIEHHTCVLDNNNCRKF
ncbi:uncharacterized protein LOC129776368 isoform X2 [Toxorhynchites rutilus septentrionalis]|uniref:uncharacterized protein LOC129776368 isoform X2 n=1 Tax=Toxorhynchites rutilus septentrionalis TaxID=329112 RepID=UPI002478F8D4|nr:uncharacterized protein LOC129776368 isoform X2 [Toxorhynchites rutilus septentrionalis]